LPIGATVTSSRVALWSDPVRFWLQTGKDAEPSNTIPPGQEAVTLFSEGFPDEAAALFPQVLGPVRTEKDKRTASYRTTLSDYAEALAATGRYSKAERVWATVLQDNPEFAFGWYRLGRVEAWLEKWDLARQDVQRAIRLGLQDPDPGPLLGSLAVYQELVANMPKESDPDTDDNLLARARALTLLGKTSEAEPAWRRLAERSNDHSVLVEALRFFAQDATAQHVAWALRRLEESQLPGERAEALRLVLQRRVEAAARVEPLLPQIHAWNERLKHQRQVR
jgi:tetratricopeptide (TPR) repeat protein